MVALLLLVLWVPFYPGKGKIQWFSFAGRDWVWNDLWPYAGGPKPDTCYGYPLVWGCRQFDVVTLPHKFLNISAVENPLAFWIDCLFSIAVALLALLVEYKLIRPWVTRRNSESTG